MTAPALPASAALGALLRLVTVAEAATRVLSLLRPAEAGRPGHG